MSRPRRGFAAAHSSRSLRGVFSACTEDAVPPGARLPGERALVWFAANRGEGIQMDTLTSIKGFRQVVESGSFVAAPTDWACRPPWSAHVMHVEMRLGVRLLTRNSRVLSPVPARLAAPLHVNLQIGSSKNGLIDL
jgi:hypothetical protein